jgi:hypothetical protein
MTRKAAETGPGAMVLVAIEQGFPKSERILIDPLAGPILPLKSRISVGMGIERIVLAERSNREMGNP